jgi:molecular chaperone GrpE
MEELTEKDKGESQQGADHSAEAGEPQTGENAESTVNPQDVAVAEDIPDELELLSAQAAEYLDGWQRARAELANYKKRVDRERVDSYNRAAGDILTEFLEIVDDLQRALEDRPQEGDSAVWADGIGMVLRKLQTLLESQGIEKLNAAGQPFDPKLHDAISHEETDDTPEGHVIDIIKDGYRMGDRVLRAAIVRVAK